MSFCLLLPAVTKVSFRGCDLSSFICLSVDHQAELCNLHACLWLYMCGLHVWVYVGLCIWAFIVCVCLFGHVFHVCVCVCVFCIVHASMVYGHRVEPTHLYMNFV